MEDGSGMDWGCERVGVCASDVPYMPVAEAGRARKGGESAHWAAKARDGGALVPYGWMGVKERLGVKRRGGGSGYNSRKTEARGWAGKTEDSRSYHGGRWRARQQRYLAPLRYLRWGSVLWLVIESWVGVRGEGWRTEG